jgi:monoamine oxidase
MTEEIRKRLDELQVGDLISWRDGWVCEIDRLSLEGDEITVHTKDGWHIRGYHGNTIVTVPPAPASSATFEPQYDWDEKRRNWYRKDE